MDCGEPSPLVVADPPGTADVSKVHICHVVVESRDQHSAEHAPLGGGWQQVYPLSVPLAGEATPQSLAKK